MNDMQSYVHRQENICRKNATIAPRLYSEYGVNLGLRDDKGNGVLTGLTNISKIVSSKIEGGVKIPCDGQVWYRGYRIEDLVQGLGERELGFEKISYLLLMGEMPTAHELSEFQSMIGYYRMLPPNFTRDVIMKASSEDIMNSMARSILALAPYDSRANDTSVSNSLRQCMRLISQFPSLAVYGYIAYDYYKNGNSMVIHHPVPSLSTAENILMMLRPNKAYTEVEAKTLDTALILHMEHGGGNNSTFTTRVVTSSGSDTYSTFSAAMSSLKGPKHGGANIKVMEMMADIKANIHDPRDMDEIERYLKKILAGEAFDRKKLIYGMGHAVYTVSDPREKILKRYVIKLAEEKGRIEDLLLYMNVEAIAPGIIMEKQQGKKAVCPNIDFYSGFVYEMLGIPIELYTAIFAIARVVGWSAHRLEELISSDKIIRPAYMSVMEELN